MIAEQHVEYRVVVGGKPCTRRYRNRWTNTSFTDAVDHASSHARREPDADIEIQSRTVTYTKWTTEVQP